MTVETLGAVTATSNGTTLTCGAANTKGSYVQLDASTAFAVAWVTIILSNQNNGGRDVLVDIATGAAGAETVVIANIWGGTQNSFPNNVYRFRLSIAAGVRIAARAQDNGGSETLDITMQIGDDDWGSGAVDTYGAVTADSGGTSIDPGAVANTKGAYVQLSASSAADLTELIFAAGNQDNAARQFDHWLVDIATGAAGAESVAIADVMVGQAATGSVNVSPNIASWLLAIASGARLAVRAQTTTTDATDRLFDAFLYASRGAKPSGGAGTVPGRYIGGGF